MFTHITVYSLNCANMRASSEDSLCSLPPGVSTSGAAGLVPRSHSQTGGAAAAEGQRRLPGEEESRQARLRVVGAVGRSLQAFPHPERRCRSGGGGFFFYGGWFSFTLTLCSGVPVESVPSGWRELSEHPAAHPTPPVVTAAHHQEV